LAHAHLQDAIIQDLVKAFGFDIQAGLGWFAWIQLSYEKVKVI
jgi:hypothetical protein